MSQLTSKIRHLQNRNASQDLDYFLDASRFGDDYEHVRKELRDLIKAVAHKLSYDPQWANDEVRIFLGLLENPELLFNQSKQQNVLLYRDSGMAIYAVKWEWVLARKLKRLQMQDQPARPEDWRDCIAITKLLYDGKGGKLSPKVFQLYDNDQREPPVFPKTITDLRRLVLEFHRLDALPVAIWSFSSSTETFDYKWSDETTIARSLWPALRGRIPVYLPDSAQWRHYDCSTQEWGGLLRGANS